jgi:hypothetical protein
MSERFTPGPWTIDPYVDAIHVLAPDGSKIASMADRNLSAQGMPPDNARLIAAAPTLFAALEELLRVDDDWHGSVNSEMAGARKAARAALAIARGTA